METNLNTPYAVYSIENNVDEIATFCDALSSKVRIKILQYMQNYPSIYSLLELSQNLKIPMTTLVHHVKKLEKAQIVRTLYKTSKHGSVKTVVRLLKHVQLDLYRYTPHPSAQLDFERQTLSVGEYADFDGKDFNFATDKELFPFYNNCFLSGREKIGLIYTSNGKVTYHFSNQTAKTKKINELTLSLELCSEAPLFDNNFKSDITFWINQKEICTYTSSGDYGDRRGKLNPDWWQEINTQYGKLVTLTVNNDGVYLNGIKYSEKVNIDGLNLSQGNKISFTLGNKENSEYVGGFNLFGKNFGDYPQDIVMTLSKSN